MGRFRRAQDHALPPIYDLGFGTNLNLIITAHTESTVLDYMLSDFSLGERNNMEYNFVFSCEACSITYDFEILKFIIR